MALPVIKTKKHGKRKNQAIMETLEENFALLVANTDVESPLTFMTKLYMDEKMPLRERLAAAQTVAGYTCKKVAQQVEVENNTNININVTQQMAIDKLDSYLFDDDMRKLDKEVRDSVIDGEIVDE